MCRGPSLSPLPNSSHTRDAWWLEPRKAVGSRKPNVPIRFPSSSAAFLYLFRSEILLGITVGIIWPHSSGSIERIEQSHRTNPRRCQIIYGIVPCLKSMNCQLVNLPRRLQSHHSMAMRYESHVHLIFRPSHFRADGIIPMINSSEIFRW